jgi:hypothetical protein
MPPYDSTEDLCECGHSRRHHAGVEFSGHCHFSCNCLGFSLFVPPANRRRVFLECYEGGQRGENVFRIGESVYALVDVLDEPPVAPAEPEPRPASLLERARGVLADAAVVASAVTVGTIELALLRLAKAREPEPEPEDRCTSFGCHNLATVHLRMCRPCQLVIFGHAADTWSTEQPQPGHYWALVRNPGGGIDPYPDVVELDDQGVVHGIGYEWPYKVALWGPAIPMPGPPDPDQWPKD